MNKQREDFLESLEHFLKAHLESTGKNPHGLLLGPKEFMVLSAMESEKDNTLAGASPTDKPVSTVKFITEFRGIPVRIKLTPGCEPELTPTEAVYYLNLENKNAKL